MIYIYILYMYIYIYNYINTAYPYVAFAWKRKFWSIVIRRTTIQNDHTLIQYDSEVIVIEMVKINAPKGSICNVSSTHETTSNTIR